jgi:methionyl-tRNA formyltransferase
MATAAGDAVNQNPGMVLEIGEVIQVACGRGALMIEELQLPGGKRLKAKDFVAGHALKVGQRFE